MGHVQPVFKRVHAAKNHDIFAHRKPLLNPAQPLEPHQLEFVGPVDESGGQPFFGSCADGLHACQQSPNLNLSRARLQVANAEHHAAVDVAVRVVRQQIAKRAQSQVARKGFGPQRTDSFQVGEGGIEPARGHTQK